MWCHLCKKLKQFLPGQEGEGRGGVLDYLRELHSQIEYLGDADGEGTDDCDLEVARESAEGNIGRLKSLLVDDARPFHGAMSWACRNAQVETVRWLLEDFPELVGRPAIGDDMCAEVRRCAPQLLFTSRQPSHARTALAKRGSAWNMVSHRCTLPP